MSSSSSKAGDNANDKVNDNSDSNNRPFSALVLGATGAIGAQIAQQLNSLANCVKFTTLHRREPQATLGDKQNAVVVNFDELEASAEAFAGHDVCFCALGTTRKDAGSAEAFRKVDHDYVLSAAKLCKSHNVPHFSIVTSQGANKDSFFLYMKTKGEVEHELKQMGFERLTIAQPGLLDRGDKTRWNEKIGKFFLGSTPVAKVAEKMIADAQTGLDEGSNDSNKVRVITKFK